MKYLYAAAFIGCILAANYVTTEYAMVPVGFGLTATAGTYFAGLSFVLRDSVQDAVRTSLTRDEVKPLEWQVALPIVALIVAGAGLSFLISAPFIALASGIAFLASETADLAVYTPLRRRGYVRAAIASNIVGALVDTVLFLTIAGFPLAAALPGQIVGKLLITAVVVAAISAVRATRPVTA